MEIPPSLPLRKIPPPLPHANKIAGYVFYIGLSLIIAMFSLGMQNRDYQAFEKLAYLIVGALVGALKLQTTSSNN